ncbi:hypothetical protein BC342_24370 [Streptomyces olivaceus]|nr:hypothetical protein BC342_24370 [Streptomyces olivaceus]
MPARTASAVRPRATRLAARTVLAAIGQRMVDGGEPSEVSREVMLLLDEMEELLSGKVLNYAVRGAG